MYTTNDDCDVILLLLMFLLVPENANQHHLDILSELAQMLSDKDFRDKLISEAEASVIHQLISNWEPYLPAGETTEGT